MCVIYLFGGLAKARGQMWWDGTALWYAVGNYEYQSLDATFLAAYPSIFTALTHITLLWEVFYCALVWPRWSRPITLALAVAVHGGIAIAMGMATFGIMMIAANGIFIGPTWIRRLRGRHIPESFGTDQTAVAEERPLTPVAAATSSTQNRAEIAAQAEVTAMKAEMERRAAELEKGEEAFRKRYKKLKAREAKVEERNERIKVTKAKLRERLEDGTMVLGDKLLESDTGLSSIGLSGIGLNDTHEDASDDSEDGLSGHDLLNRSEE
jgi:ABC-type multidrug transport system fused ATPase/permease subunit